MARRNDQRRAALVDAAIGVPAREGARGLTFRAVDAEAAVPTGTASNYFTSRADLAANVAHHESAGLPGDATAVALLCRTPRRPVRPKPYRAPHRRSPGSPDTREP